MESRNILTLRGPTKTLIGFETQTISHLYIYIKYLIESINVRCFRLLELVVSH